MTLLSEIQEPAKSPNFNRSYLRKYCEPSSKILRKCSLGCQLRSLKISAPEPSYKKCYSENSTMTFLSEIQELAKSPNFNRSYLQKYCEPSSEILR